MISQFIITLALCLGLGDGTYTERELKMHQLKICAVTFQELKSIHSVIDDPEIKHRLKDIAWLKWCIETDEKYRQADYYGENAQLKYDLQLADFEYEWYN